MNAYEVLKERGFIEQLTHEEEIKALFEKGGVTFYIGIDPTADSLHVGHFLTVMAMAHMQRCGNRPICLVGGGTDGARLSFMGLPCPNLFAGGHNFHSNFEFVPVESMEKAVEMIVRIAELATSLDFQKSM